VKFKIFRGKNSIWLRIILSNFKLWIFSFKINSNPLFLHEAQTRKNRFLRYFKLNCLNKYYKTSLSVHFAPSSISIVNICGFYKKKIGGFQNFPKSNFVRSKFLKNRSSLNLPCGHARSHLKFGPDRFSRFDVY